MHDQRVQGEILRDGGHTRINFKTLTNFNKQKHCQKKEDKKQYPVLVP